MSQAAMSFPARVNVPYEWVFLGNLQFEDCSVPIWASCEAERSFGQSIVFAEIIVLDSQSNCLGHTVVTLRTSSDIDWALVHEAVQGFFPQWPLRIDKLRCGGCSWGHGQTVLLDLLVKYGVGLTVSMVVSPLGRTALVGKDFTMILSS